MPKRRNIVFLGNCQAQSLAAIYQRFFALDQEDAVFYADSQLFRMERHAVYAMLGKADVVVNQIFDFQPQIPRSAIASDAVIVDFPAVIASFYWPHASQPHILTPEGFANPPYPAQLGDRYLNNLISKGFTPEDALDKYLNLNIAKMTGIDRLFELYMDRQKSRDDESGCDVAAYFETSFRSEHMFLTPDHPNLGVFGVLAQHVYGRLGIGSGKIDAALARLSETPFPRLALPIHPKVIDHFKLSFADSDTVYPFFDEGGFNFSDYVLRYMGYVWNPDLRKALYGNLPAAERAVELQAALQQSPRSAEGWRILCTTFLELGKLDDARHALTRAEDIEGDGGTVRALDARLELAVSNFDGALAKVRESVALYPNSEGLQRLYVELTKRAGKADEAVAAAQEGVSLNPGERERHDFLISVLEWAGRDQDAAQASHRRDLFDAVATDADKPVDRAVREAVALYQGGQPVAALTKLLNIVPDGIRDATVLLEGAELALACQDASTAELWYRTALGFGFASEEFVNGLAVSLLHQERAEEAEDIIRPLAAAKNVNPHVLATFGMAQIKSGRLLEASMTIRSAMAIAPELDGLQNVLDEIYGRIEKADS